jgi:2-polyprenyl-3-methyl-5-hydroxy-6-metoxy-1,4-benzoquinol methylase
MEMRRNTADSITSERCVVCGSFLSSFALKLRPYRTCRNCDHTWYHLNAGWDQAEDKNSFGDWDTDYYQDDKIFEFHKMRLSGFQSIVARLNKVCPERGCLLDIGAGVGVLMHTAAKAGWTVEGVEPSLKAAEYGRRLTDSIIHDRFLKDLDLPAGHYHAVTMIDVLRHIPDFIEFLFLAKRLLRRDGVLLIREANRRSLESVRWCREWLKGNVKGQSSTSIRRVTDFHRFSPRSVLYALHRVGCRQSWVEPSPLFLEIAPGRNPILPTLKRSVTLASNIVYQASFRRIVTSPGMLAFGRL